MTNDAPANEVLQDETTITEITIQPDGRLYVFGTSRQVLEVLDNLHPNDARLSQLLDHVRAREASAHHVLNTDGD